MIEQQPQLVNRLLQLGKMLQLMGREADAIAHYWQGRALSGLGDVTEASSAYRASPSSGLNM